MSGPSRVLAIAQGRSIQFRFCASTAASVSILINLAVVQARSIHGIASTCTSTLAVGCMDKLHVVRACGHVDVR
jgi:hypothetical protein